jgi:hypothetical protein
MVFLDDTGCYPDFFYPPLPVEEDLIFVVARPHVTLMVALAKEA